MSDISNTFLVEYARMSDLREEFINGDTILQCILNIVELSPSLSHVSSISMFCFLWTIVEILCLNSTLENALSVESFLRGERCNISAQLRNIAKRLVHFVGARKGCLPEKNDEVFFKDTSIYGVEGQAVKVGISNALLSHLCAMCMEIEDIPVSDGASSSANAWTIKSSTFLPFLFETIVSRNANESAFVHRMSSIGTYLSKQQVNGRCRKSCLQEFFSFSRILHSAMKETITLYNGPGVGYKSRFQPDIIQQRKLSNSHIKPTITTDVSKSLMRKAMKGDSKAKSTFSKAFKSTTKETSGELVHDIPDLHELFVFFYRMVKAAESVVLRIESTLGREEILPIQAFRAIRAQIFREFMISHLALDCSGNISDLYEEYIHSFFMRTFDEREGIVTSMKPASRKRTLAQVPTKEKPKNSRTSRLSDNIFSIGSNTL